MRLSICNQLVLVQLGLILLLCSCQKQSAVTVAQPTPIATATQQSKLSQTQSSRLQFVETVDLGNEQQIVKREIHSVGAGKIDISYPHIVGSTGRNIAKLNVAMKEFAIQNRHPLMRGATSRSKEEYAYEIAIRYSVELVTDDSLSIAFHEYWSASGAAHPSQSYYAFNYNRKTNQVLKLREMFRKDAQYLERLSEYCNKALAAQTGYPVRDLTPAPKNFLTWHLTKDSLCIDFDRCDHMPCVSGEQIVAIPYAELKDILNLEGVLKTVVSQ